MNDDIHKALEVLKKGGVILYPTDTIWGLGCDATNFDAVERIYDIKMRPDHKSLLVLIDDAGRIPSYVEHIPEVAWDLLEVADKPLTLIYPKAKNLAHNLVGEDESIGIRVTSDLFCQKLIQRFKKPIVSTSANESGTPPPASFDEISDKIKDQVDYIVNWKQDDTSKKTPSGIIKLGPKGEIKIIRK